MSTKVELIRPRFEGSRFDNHSIPLEFLGDLAALGQLIKELAKHNFFKGNKSRKRLPNGFYNEVRLELSSIEEGSAICPISAQVRTPELFESEILSLYKKSASDIIDCVMNSSNTDFVTKRIPLNLLSSFNKIGNNLRQDEVIQLSDVNNSNSATLDLPARKRLIQISNLEKQYDNEFEVRGIVTAMNKEKKTFDIKTVVGDIISGSYNMIFKDDIEFAFINKEKGQKIMIQGQGKFNQSDELLKIRMITDLDFLEDLDLTSQFIKLSMLSSGWYNGVGMAPDKDKSEKLLESFINNLSPDAKLPYIFPTPDGNLQAEWKLGNGDIILEFNLNSPEKSELLVLNDSNESTTPFNWGIESDWKILNSNLLS